MVLESTQVNATLSETPNETHGAHTSPNATRTIRVAIANDYELVVAGVAALLAPYPQVEIVELTANRIPRSQADIILFDTYGHRDLGMNRVKELVNDEHGASVVVYTFEFEPGLVDRPRDPAKR